MRASGPGPSETSEGAWCGFVEEIHWKYESEPDWSCSGFKKAWSLRYAPRQQTKENVITHVHNELSDFTSRLFLA